ncbi:MAG: hypothetical protein ACREGI_01255 [Candidatus Levyibacteriota bacterium]
MQQDQQLLNFQTLFYNILDAIGFAGNKEKFVDDVTSLCYKETLIKSARRLPEDQQETFLNEVKSYSSQEEIMKVIHEKFPADEFQKALAATIEDVLTDYFKSINKSLDETQRQAVLARVNAFKEDVEK